MDFTWAYILVPFISAGAGAFFGSYLKRKGENLATHEDIDLLLDQVRAVTQTTKEIEASISDKLWNKQRHWEMKQEAVYSVMQAMGMTDAAVTDLANALRTQKKSKTPQMFDEVLTDRWLKAYESLEDLERKRSLALIVCGAGLTDTLFTIKNAYRDICHELADDELNSYQMHSDALRKRMAEAFAYARRELGLERGAKLQSTGSSATPNPD
jgi:hypothetical protein